MAELKLESRSDPAVARCGVMKRCLPVKGERGEAT